jgi:hypothetical protein
MDLLTGLVRRITIRPFFLPKDHYERFESMPLQNGISNQHPSISYPNGVLRICYQEEHSKGGLEWVMNNSPEDQCVKRN